MRTDLYGLATVDGDTVKVPDRGLGGVLVDHGDESITFSGVVDVGDFAAPVVNKLTLLYLLSGNPTGQETVI